MKKLDEDPTEVDIAVVSAAADRLGAAAEALDTQNVGEYLNLRYAEWAATLAELLPQVPAVVAKLGALRRAHAARLERQLAKLDRDELKRGTPAVAEAHERLRRLIQATLQTLKDADRLLEAKATTIRTREGAWLKSWSLRSLVQDDVMDLEGRLAAPMTVQTQLDAIPGAWKTLTALLAWSGDTVRPAPEETIPGDPPPPARPKTVLDGMEGRLPS